MNWKQVLFLMLCSVCAFAVPDLEIPIDDTWDLPKAGML